MKISSERVRWVAYAITIITGLLLTIMSCKKDNHDHADHNEDVLEKYNEHVPAEAMQELQQAKTATQKYRSLNAAIADGYVDINVTTQNMGFHYMKPAYADTVFDPQKPEILVYNKQHNGDTMLVAVEYAVPIPLMPAKAPAGFAGGADVWTYSTEFNLWLLHAWVWEYNPLGVFIPTNPNVHLH
ncbi:MAG: hypothetical protein EOP49_38440 [Sphingobacteriales bacterium]|nr:MAG: hypothetical protein EOP49_38440 [Sphingobacteriales bacterium]